MKIDNCYIETESRYVNDEDEPYGRNTSVDYLVINIELPGGKATYDIKITKQQRESIEHASKLKVK